MIVEVVYFPSWQLEDSFLKNIAELFRDRIKFEDVLDRFTKLVSSPFASFALLACFLPCCCSRAVSVHIACTQGIFFVSRVGIVVFGVCTLIFLSSGAPQHHLPLRAHHGGCHHDPSLRCIGEVSGLFSWEAISSSPL